MTSYDEIWSKMYFWYVLSHLETIYNMGNVIETSLTKMIFNDFSVFSPFTTSEGENIEKIEEKNFFFASKIFSVNHHNMTWYVCRICFMIQRTCFCTNKTISMISGHFSANFLNHQNFQKNPQNCDFCPKSIFPKMLDMLSCDDIWVEMSSRDLKKSFGTNFRHPRYY